MINKILLFFFHSVFTGLYYSVIIVAALLVFVQTILLKEVVTSVKPKVSTTYVPIYTNRDVKVPNNLIKSGMPVQYVIDTMIASLNLKDRAILMSIAESDEVNAYAQITDKGYEVHILTGVIEEADNIDQIAIVVGHEIAHHLLGHTAALNEQGLNTPPLIATGESAKYLEVKQLELMSDLTGAALAEAAGYNPCEGVKFWAKMRVKFGDKQSDTHPTPSARMEQLNRVFTCT